jgi:hypothetical protein
VTPPTFEPRYVDMSEVPSKILTYQQMPFIINYFYGPGFITPRKHQLTSDISQEETYQQNLGTTITIARFNNVCELIICDKEHGLTAYKKA